MAKTKKPEAKKASVSGKSQSDLKRGAGKAKDQESTDITEAQAAAATPEVDQEEAEEQAEAASFQKSSANEAEAAAGGEVSLSFKNFRHHPEMENFYRFIYENDLRYEALAIIDQVMIAKGAAQPAAAQKKSAKGSKSKSH